MVRLAVEAVKLATIFTIRIEGHVGLLIAMQCCSELSQTLLFGLLLLLFVWFGPMLLWKSRFDGCIREAWSSSDIDWTASIVARRYTDDY